MSGNGRTVIPMGATLHAAISTAAALNGRTLENGGTLLWTGPGSLTMNPPAVVTNRAGALFEIQNASPVVANNGFCRIDNAGIVRKTISVGTTSLAAFVGFNNYGMVDIRSGVLAANGSYTSSSNALLRCALGGTDPGTNHGQLRVAGTVPLNGALSVDFSNSYLPATNDSFTVVTAGTRNGAFANFFYPSNAVTMQLSNTPNSVIVRVSGVAIPEVLLFPPLLSSSNVFLSWTADPSKTYRLEYSPNLNLTNWNAVPGDVTTLSNRATKLDVLTSSNRFYRVRVLP